MSSVEGFGIIGVFIAMVAALSSLGSKGNIVDSQRNDLDAYKANLSDCQTQLISQEVIINNLTLELANVTKDLNEFTAIVKALSERKGNLTKNCSTAEINYNTTTRNTLYWQIGSGVGGGLSATGGIFDLVYGIKSTNCQTQYTTCQVYLAANSKTIAQQKEIITQLNAQVEGNQTEQTTLKKQLSDCMTEKAVFDDKYKLCSKDLELCTTDRTNVEALFGTSSIRLKNSMESYRDYSILMKNKCKFTSTVCYDSKYSGFFKSALKECRKNTGGVILEFTTAVSSFGFYFQEKFPENDGEYLRDENSFVYIKNNGTLCDIKKDKAGEAFLFPLDSEKLMLVIGNKEIVVEEINESFAAVEADPGKTYAVDATNVYHTNKNNFKIIRLIAYNVAGTCKP